MKKEDFVEGTRVQIHNYGEPSYVSAMDQALNGQTGTVVAGDGTYYVTVKLDDPNVHELKSVICAPHELTILS